MKRIRKPICRLLVICMLVTMLPMSVFAESSEIASGTCGENLTWVLDDTGTLTISGSGAMKDYPVGGSAPWNSNRTRIKSIIIVDGVTTIGSGAFYNCTELTSINVPNSTNEIGSSAFRGCSSLTEVVLPNSITTIGGSAFFGCSSLTNINIPDGVVEIGKYAFRGCESIISFSIPNSVTVIGERAFYGCNLTGIWVDDNNPNYSSDIFGVLFNKDYSTLIQVPNQMLGSYTIPESVSNIEDYAFYCCRDLQSIKLPDTITCIGESVFNACDSLSEISIPEGVTSIGRWAFDYCNNLVCVSLPISVTSVGDAAFDNCKNISDVYYKGAKEDWTNISFGISNTNLTNATIHYHSDLDTTDNENDGAKEFSGHWYKLITEEMNWIEADEYCRSIGGHLVTITSEGENSFVQSLISESTMIGLSDASEEGVWTWVTGEDVTYTNWAKNEPNNEANEDYALMRADGTWNDGHLQKENRVFVCEWESVTDIEIPDPEESQCAHTWDSGTETKKQTCTEGGEITFTCTLCGENKMENSLPLGHDYVERICNRCGKRDFNLEYDVWSFDNSYASYGAASEGYYISYADYQRLISNLTETEKYTLLIRETEKEIGDKGAISIIKQKLSNYNIDNAFTDEQCINWGGSCYGMSTWVCLNSYGIRKASDIDGSTPALNLYNNRPEVESAINYYHFQQKLDQVLSTKKEYMSLSQSEQIEILKKLGQQANETGKTFLICYSYYSVFNPDGSCDTTKGGGHAVVGYGWEEIEPREISVLDTKYTYNYRILVYDCADPEHALGDRNIYYNDDGVWCIPGYKMVSDDSKTADDRSDNANLEIVTSDVSVLNGVDYVSGECAPLVAITTLETAADMPYTFESNGCVASISGFTVTSEKEDHGIIVTMNSNVTSDGESTSTTSTAILPEADSYTVVSENDGISFSFQNENYLTSCSVGSSGSMIFLQNGTVSVSADESAMYYLNLVTNDGYNTLPWHQIEIAGTDASEISIKKANEGIIVHCDNLDTIIIAVTDEEGTTEVSGSTNGESVLITERNGNPTLYEDTDGDGIYETDITACVTDAHRYSAPVFSWTEDYGCHATFTCTQGDDTQIIDCTVTSETTPATETAAGKTVYTATVAFGGQTYTETKTVVIPATGHINHITTLVSAVDATCEHPGNTAYYTCLGCEDWFLDASGTVVIADKTSVVTVMLGHSFTNYVSNSNASCTVDGTKTAKCDRCDATDTVADVGSSKGHKYETTWSKDEVGHWHNCSCGDKTENAPHTYSEWVTTKKADVGVEGSKERTCSVCGYKQTEKLPATTTPATGDNTPIGLLFAMMLISACGMISLLFTSLKRKGKRQRYNC